MKTDHALLEAALVGYQAKLAEIDAAMADLRSRLGQSPAAKPVSAAKPAPRKMSAAGRARIIAAQKKRWAAYKKQQSKA